MEFYLKREIPLLYPNKKIEMEDILITLSKQNI